MLTSNSLWSLIKVFTALLSITAPVPPKPPVPPGLPKQNGFCVTSTGRDQNSGVVKLNGLDTGTAQAQAACLRLCKARQGATGCEAIWGQGNRGCYVHTQEVARGNGARNHACWVFAKPGGGAPGWVGCTTGWQSGDGTGGTEKMIGTFSGPKECVDKCKIYKNNGQSANAATVDSVTRKKCYCEFGATGKNSNNNWKTCMFKKPAPTSIWTGCKWFPGDGIGGFEKRIGTFPNPGVCVQKCKGYKLNGIIANAVTVDSKTGKSCYCEFKSTGRNSNRDWKSCMIAPKDTNNIWKGCIWKVGDGTGGPEKNIGTFSGPKECVEKCKGRSQGGKMANMATVDSATGKKCFCEFGATGQNQNRNWKTCTIPGTGSVPGNSAPPWDGCTQGWQPGDGTGGTEKMIGTFSGPKECVAKCNTYKNNGKLANAATVDTATRKKCYCEFDATGKNSNANWKTCMIRKPSTNDIWKGCEWKPGDGIGGFEKKIGTFANPAICVQKCKGYKYNGAVANAVTVDSKTGKSCFCEFKSTGRNGNRNWKSCLIAPKDTNNIWKGCIWKVGDGTGGPEQKIGIFSGPKECVDKCKGRSRNGKMANMATVDSATGKKCFCEFGAMGQNQNRAWKTCKIPGAETGGVWGGCDWKIGDGTGGPEQNIGTFSGPKECVAKCKTRSSGGKPANMATVDAATGKKCFCEFGAKGRNSNKSWKSCFLSTAGRRDDLPGADVELDSDDGSYDLSEYDEESEIDADADGETATNYDGTSESATSYDDSSETGINYDDSSETGTNSDDSSETGTNYDDSSETGTSYDDSSGSDESQDYPSDFIPVEEEEDDSDEYDRSDIFDETCNVLK